MRNCILKILFLFIFIACIQTAFGQARLVESAPYQTSELANLRLGNLLDEIEKTPNCIGYIVIYGGKVNKIGEIEGHLYGIQKSLDSKKIDRKKILVISGGFRERLTLEYWIIPKGATPPLPTPTISIEKVKFRGFSRNIIPHFSIDNVYREKFE